MAGRTRTRNGQPRPTCEMVRKNHRCTTIPLKGWRYCPHHHEIAARKLASQWERDLDRHSTTVKIKLPDLGKTLNDLDHEERAALGHLISWQHHDLELPTAD